jgi:hypothetical protein
MKRIAREHAPCALAALLGCALLAYLGLKGFAWSDYESEARPAFDALTHGHLENFLRLAPAYGGSLIERAPFALIPGLWGGGALAVYRSVALPCLFAAALLGIWLVARMRSEGRPRFARALALAVCVANPLTLRALELGHPEELLGACLCVAAVLLAASDRPLWAGLVLGLAVANKEWALLAAGPVLLALPARRRLPCAAAALAATGVVLAPLLLVHDGGFSATVKASASPGTALFHPWQIWWFFGHRLADTPGAPASVALGYRVAPAWIGSLTHPLVLLAGLTLTVGLWLQRRVDAARNRSSARGVRLDARSALLALALLMLMRCLLDTWDTGYYLLPFLFALLAWETRGAVARPPALAAGASVLGYVSFVWLSNHASPDVQAASFLIWSLPLAALLALALFRPARSRSGAPEDRPRARPLRGAQETTVSAFSRPLSTS